MRQCSPERREEAEGYFKAHIGTDPFLQGCVDGRTGRTSNARSTRAGIRRAHRWRAEHVPGP